MLANDFEQAIFRLYPEIERAREALSAAGANGVLLSGSGASVFGLFDNAEQREVAQARLRVEPGWQVFATTTISRRAYAEAFSAVGFL
jgi:4-diphosphocytidyl-2-C-methyl-D-erythritol kinase